MLRVCAKQRHDLTDKMASFHRRSAAAAISLKLYLHIVTNLYGISRSGDPRSVAWLDKVFKQEHEE